MQLRMSTVLDDLTTRLAFRRRAAAQRRAAYRRLVRLVRISDRLVRAERAA
jgi:hypothetical protein